MPRVLPHQVNDTASILSNKATSLGFKEAAAKQIAVWLMLDDVQRVAVRVEFFCIADSNSRTCTDKLDHHKPQPCRVLVSGHS